MQGWAGLASRCLSPVGKDWRQDSGRAWKDALQSLARGSSAEEGVQCWTSNVLHVQNWRKAIYKKYWNLLIRNYSAGLFSDHSLTKNQPRNTFLQNIYSMSRRVSSSHRSRGSSLGPSNQLSLLCSYADMPEALTALQLLPLFLHSRPLTPTHTFLRKYT